MKLRIYKSVIWPESFNLETDDGKSLGAVSPALAAWIVVANSALCAISTRRGDCSCGYEVAGNNSCAHSSWAFLQSADTADVAQFGPPLTEDCEIEI